MASLLENLIDILDRENTEYEALVVLADQKTPAIVEGDVESLGKITEDEQEIVGRIQRMEKSRREVLADIANVVNKDVETLKLINLIQMLGKRPDQQQLLMDVQAKLKGTIDRLREANDKNQMLLTDALEMVGFNLNMLRALKSAPQTANYTKSAYCTGSQLGMFHGSFDAKQ
ncbi:MAG: flagellar protein FlgN [Lachnospiraceae bacterium]|nr:flagellar protein FlgN [Lachnospiraceae bacterium]